MLVYIKIGNTSDLKKKKNLNSELNAQYKYVSYLMKFLQIWNRVQMYLLYLEIVNILHS